MRKNILMTITIFILLAVITVNFVFAYFYLSLSVDQTEDFGLVDVKPYVYFVDASNNEHEPVLYETIDGNKKLGIYEINVSNVGSVNYISKLRVLIKVNSNIDTYFRVQIVDTLTLKLPIAGGFRELSVPNEGILYPFNGSNWYFDVENKWYYYTVPVIKDSGSELVIPFISSATNLDLKSPSYRIQFGIVIEAVQAVRGPQENWELPKTPWSGGDW